MGFIVVPVQACSGSGLGQDGFTIGQPGKADRVKGAERVKRVSLDAGSFDRRVEKAQVEKRIVSHQNGAAAVVRLDRLAHGFEYALQGFFLRLGETKGMMGIDTCESQGLWIQIGIGKRLHMNAYGSARNQHTPGVHIDDHGGDFQQCICAGIESAGFHVHYNGQKTAETPVYAWRAVCVHGGRI
ncbi:hypothetical protein TBH_C0687 [Thiolapillus brandeum]|uniref:Uncharacterized protein n=1 Tax=Thiolapillus brandeum TaxID=1076588 RepID=A0A7U6GHA6_9GAMM|nr:hypothetical protein TBH_C0687 [Thiolapillus brandeum]